MKVYVYKMHAGTCGTDEVHLHVGETELDCGTIDEIVYDHATSYYEQDEDGEWEDGDPEIWLEATVTTLEELEEQSGYILCGADTLEDLVTQLESEGMVWAESL